MSTRSEVSLGPLGPCPYLPGEQLRFEVFSALRVRADELDRLLQTGWRKFGTDYFRPACPSCRACIPIRLPAGELRLTRSQRKARNHNRDTEVRVGPLAYRDEIYDVYREHSLFTFGKLPSVDDLLVSFYMPSCDALQTEYYVAGDLAAIGFIDRSAQALSSVYFVYRHRYRKLSLGVYSVLAECAYARSLGLRYYYLGYYIERCSHMWYKGRYRPHQLYDWSSEQWVGDESATDRGGG